MSFCQLVLKFQLWSRDLDEELQRPLLAFLEERSVDAELAVFLHQYMMHKDRREFVRWMEKIKSYLEK